MRAATFAHIGLNCKDMAKTESFYVKHFGFKRVRLINLGHEQIIFLRSGQVVLELFQAKGESPEPPHNKDGPAYAGVRHIAFVVDDVDAKLKAMGDEAKVSLGPMSFDAFIKGWRTAWIQDPDGRIVEITKGYTDEDSPPKS